MDYYLSEKQILIYGAGQLGKTVADILEKAGNTILGFIDKRAAMYENFEGKDVYFPDELITWNNKNSYAIIVTIKDAYSHNKIAVFFRENGFYNIIFRPLYVLKGGKDNLILNSLMKINGIIGDGKQNWTGCIPDIRSENLYILPRTDLILKENDYVKAYIPAQSLFLNDFNEVMPIMYNLIVASPIVKMYEEFISADLNKNHEGLNKYKEISRGTSKNSDMPIGLDWEHSWLNGKSNVYQNMCSQMALNPLFFVESCPRVCYRKPFVFVMKGSGKNRVSFQLAKGYSYIPVEMSAEDYDLWNNNVDANDFCMEETIVPISHPFFYGMQTITGDYVHLWLKLVGRYLYKAQLKKGKHKITCLDCSDDNGEMSRFLSILGIDVRRLGNESIIKYDKIFGVQIPYTVKTEEKSVYDAIVIFRMEYDYKAMRDIVCNYTDRNSLIFIAGKIDEENIPAEELGLVKKEVLFSTVWGGAYVSGEMYMRK